MPTLSRRKAARRNDMEDIEDDTTPQHPIRDEVQESDGEQATSKKSIGKRRALQEVSNDLDSDSDDPIDVENFPNQPLKRNQLNTLQSLAEDWQKLAEVTSRTFGMYGSAAGALADLDDDNAKGRVKEIDGYMCESLDFVAHINVYTDTLAKLRQRGIEGEKIIEVGQVYTKDATANIANYSGKTLRQKYAKQDAYAAFKTSIWEAQHPGMPMPPITEQLPRGTLARFQTDIEQGDNSGDDDDVEVGGVSQKYECPITRRPLDDPYTSKVCGHSFSAEALKFAFRTPNQPNKCPAYGCSKSYRLIDCQPNKDLAKKAKAYKRRMEREQILSDVEEIVD